jgi:uncharacterized protein
MPIKKVENKEITVTNKKVQYPDGFMRNMLALNTTLLSRMDLIREMSSGRNKDIEQECGYPEDPGIKDYKHMYLRNGVGTRVVKLYPEESWASFPKIYETEKAEKTPFELAVRDLIVSKNIFYQLKRADILSGIGRFGIILLGINDGGKLEEPVKGINPKTGERYKNSNINYKLLYLKSFDEGSVFITQLDRDTTSPRYGMPLSYTVYFSEKILGGSILNSQKVHWTRVVHLADNRDSSDIYGRPRMEPVFNNLLDLIKTRGGSGEMFWKGGFPGISFETMPGMEDATIDDNSLRMEMTKYMEGLQRYIAVEGMSAKSLAVQVADPTGHVKANLQEICIALGSPMRVFMGNEAGQLASMQDTDMWNKRIKLRREEYLSCMVLRPFFDRLITFGILPQIDSYKIWWPDLNNPSDKDVATIGDLRTTALTKYVAGGVDMLIPPKEYLTMIIGLSEEEADAIITASTLYNSDSSIIKLPTPNIGKPNLTGEGRSVKAGKSLIDTQQAPKEGN